VTRLLPVAVAVVVLLSSACSGSRTAEGSDSPDLPDACPTDGAPVLVDDATGLSDALAEASPGDVITLAPGSYAGSFVASIPGTADRPVVLCGDDDAVLDGGSVDAGYTLHLDGASHWQVRGLTITGGQKGVMLDGVTGSVLSGITVTDVGDEAIHLRRHSSGNRVEDSTVARTGLRRPEFGEGVYIGSAESNWCELTDCAPDTSDDNEIVGTTVSDVTAEAVDVKEGTSGGVLRDNVLSGPAGDEVDSVVDLKGSGWTVTGNQIASDAEDGIQVHVILDGWGADNLVRDNTITMRDGYAVHLVGAADGTGNQVGCGQAAHQGEDSNVECG
jgi:hypothetical protein